MITIDELCMDTPTPIDAMRRDLAALHGVPVDQVQLQGTHEEGRMIVGDFVVRKMLMVEDGQDPTFRARFESGKVAEVSVK